jgi:hypothetical protein
MTKETYTGIFSPGDRVTVVADNLDGSWEGASGTVVATRFQKGGTFAPSRNVELVLLDDEDTGEFDVLTAILAKRRHGRSLARGLGRVRVRGRVVMTAIKPATTRRVVASRPRPTR